MKQTICQRKTKPCNWIPIFIIIKIMLLHYKIVPIQSYRKQLIMDLNRIYEYLGLVIWFCCVLCVNILCESSSRSVNNDDAQYFPYDVVLLTAGHLNGRFCTVAVQKSQSYCLEIECPLPSSLHSCRWCVGGSGLDIAIKTNNQLHGYCHQYFIYFCFCTLITYTINNSQSLKMILVTFLNMMEGIYELTWFSHSMDHT